VDFLTGGLNVSLGNSNFGETILIAGVEHLSGDGLSETSYFFGAESMFDQFTLGAQYSSTAALFDADSIEVYGIYHPTEALDVTASYLSIEPSGSSTIVTYGIDAQYTFAQGVFVQAGLVHQEVSSYTDDAFTASLGIDF